MSDFDQIRRDVEIAMAKWSAQRAAEEKASTDYFRGFAEALESEDLTGVLIRGHLYVENEMNNVLAVALPRFADAGLIEGTFANKFRLLSAMALISSEQRHAISKLNSIRNGIAHMAIPGVIPVVTSRTVNELWDSLGPELQRMFNGSYSRKGSEATNLRQIIMNIMITLHVLAEVGEGGFEDIVRYNLTGQTVQQRIQAAREAAKNDPKPLSALKRDIVALPHEQRDNLRTWMREVFHY